MHLDKLIVEICRDVLSAGVSERGSGSRKRGLEEAQVSVQHTSAEAVESSTMVTIRVLVRHNAGEGEMRSGS